MNNKNMNGEKSRGFKQEFKDSKDLEKWLEIHRIHSMDAFKQKQLTRIVSLWYLLALIIYTVCALLGFGVAYFVIRLFIELKIY